MSAARNYYRWILEHCRTHLGRVVLEHGAGIGTFSAFLLIEAIEKLVVVEPAANLIPILRERLAPWGETVELVSSSLEEAAHTLRGQAIDTVISVNVLEHIPDDRRTLRTMWEILPEGGQVILFVPALPWLYGSLDRAFEHVRRYWRQELHEKVSAAGFRTLSTRFMNFPGMAAWLVAGRILRRRTLDLRAVKLYDRYAIPIIAKLERLHPPPIGQSVLLIAEKRRSRP
ncbi:MAG: methyltransferase domain-containing protein [Nitrospiraceae bacterium]